MTAQEFSERVAKFMAPEEIADYESAYEPAYMNAYGVGKDDFCFALKDKKARAVVAALGRALVRRAKNYEELNRLFNDTQTDLRTLEIAHSAMRFALQSKLSEFSAACDRAFAEGWFKPQADRLQSHT